MQSGSTRLFGSLALVISSAVLVSCCKPLVLISSIAKRPFSYKLSEVGPTQGTVQTQGAYFLTGNHGCQSVMISKNWALSSESCHHDFNLQRNHQYPLRIGERLVIVNVKRVIRHLFSGRNSGKFSNLVLVNFHMSGADTALPVFKPFTVAADDINPGVIANSLAWTSSETEQGHLQPTNVTILPNAACSLAFNDVVESEPWRDDLICSVIAPPGSACQVIEGGALIFNGDVYAINTRRRRHGCSSLRRPEVFTKLGPYRNWILENIGRD